MNTKKKEYDIDKIIKQVENKIKELEKEKQKKQRKENSIADLDDIIKEIDKKIQELDKDNKTKKIDINKLNEKINQKLSKLEDFEEDVLDRTIYDLSEISKTVNDTIKQLEKKKKEKKRKKAMYCDLARKNAKKNK